MMTEQKHVIPEGYKQTDIGLYPIDWNTPKLSEICILVNGRAFKPYEWSIDGLPIVRIQNLNGSEDFNYYSGNYDPKVFIKSGQLLFAWSGSRGTSFGPHIWKGADALLNYHTWKLVIKDQKVEEAFFFHILKLLTKQIEDAAHGASALVHTQKNEMERFLVPLPENKQEQTAIANALSDIDALISELEKLIAKKQAIKTATMQQLLTGKTRLPQFALREDGTPKGYKQSELGEIPEDWEVVEFGVFIQKVIDNRGKTPPLASDGFPMVEVNAIYKQGKSPNLEKVVKYVSKSTYECWFRDGHPEIGNILLVTVGSAGETSFVDKEGFCIAQNLIGLKINRMYNSEFVYYITRSVPFKKQVDAVLMGAVQPSLKVPHLSKFLFPFSKNKQEQTTIASILSDMDEEIQTLQQRLNKTRQIKQGMMQELLTGKTRLVQPEVTV